MPRYFFDTHDGDRLVRDDTGQELDGVEHAETAAVAALPDMARDATPEGDRRDFTVTVRDGGGQPVLKASLSLRIERLARAGRAPVVGSPAAAAG